MSKKRVPRVKRVIYNSNIGFILFLSLALFGLIFVLLEFSKPKVLGEKVLLARGGDDGGNSGSGSSGSSGNSGSESNSNIGSSGSSGNTTETKSEAGIKTKSEVKPTETRQEVKINEGEKIRVRTKDGRTRVDITSGGVKTRLEYRDDRVIIKAENEDGTETEIEGSSLLKIDQRLAADQIKIATSSAGMVLARGNTGAVSSFPLIVDLATNSLTVNTPSGDKTVTVLPDQAVKNLLAANVVSRIGGQALVSEIAVNGLTNVEQVISLGLRNGVPVYEITGVSDQKLLGFIPVAIARDVAVSTETGEVVSTNQSLLSSIFDLLSL